MLRRDVCMFGICPLTAKPDRRSSVLNPDIYAQMHALDWIEIGQLNHWNIIDSIFSRRSIKLLGMRKTVVYYKGRVSNGRRSDWIMHEYRLHTSEHESPQEEGWVVCRAFKKPSLSQKQQAGNWNNTNTSSYYYGIGGRISDSYNSSPLTIRIFPNATTQGKLNIQLNQQQQQQPLLSSEYDQNQMADLPNLHHSPSGLATNIGNINDTTQTPVNNHVLLGYCFPDL